MDAWVYPRERTLGRLTLILGVLGWLVLIAGTLGVALLYVMVALLAYVFAHSALIAQVKGTGVRLSAQQCPDLYQRYEQCCDKLGIGHKPEVFLLHGDGLFNAMATRFLGRDFVILLSDVVDAMDEWPDGVNFYIGHELGHIRMGHLTGRKWRAPALWLPLLGAAYARAQESTCDLHGAVCCEQPEHAARAMAALAAGAKRWQTMNLDAYREQARESGGFWMSYHELTGSYPWLIKRIARITGHEQALPSRHRLAWVMAALVPNLGRASGVAGPWFLVGLIGVLAAVGVPAYHDHQVRSRLALVHTEAQAVAKTLGDRYRLSQEVPQSLASVGVPATLPSGATLELDGESMALTVTAPEGGFELVPMARGDGEVEWTCQPSGETPERLLPPACQLPPSP